MNPREIIRWQILAFVPADTVNEEEMADAVLAALREAGLVIPQWQPIETAPTGEDDPDVILYFPSLCVPVRQGFWHDEMKRWCPVNWSPQHPGDWPKVQATLWMHFPAPPRAMISSSEDPTP